MSKLILNDEQRAAAAHTPEYQAAYADWYAAHEVYAAANAELRKKRTALNKAFDAAARKIAKQKDA